MPDAEIPLSYPAVFGCEYYLYKTGSLVNVENLMISVKPKVVVISRRESLLGCAVEYLTTDEKEWMVLLVSECHTISDVSRKVAEANPNIVILSRKERGYDEQLSAQLLQDCPELNKVILVSLSENFMEVYGRQRIQVKSVEDIYAVVDEQFSMA